MAEFPMDLKDIPDQDSAVTITEILVEMAFDEKGLKKDFLHNFFTSILNNLENQSASPKTKFYSIFILKELSLKDKVTLKLFSTFSQHPLYNYLQELALSVDPKKPISEKGKNLFPTDKQTGNDYIRIILESLSNWGSRFPTNSKKQPTRFKKTLAKLIDERVVIPKDFIYYPSIAQKKSQKGQTPTGTKEQLPSKKVTPSAQNISNAPSMPKVKQNKQKTVSQIKFMYNKIQTLLGILQDSEQQQEIRRQVQSYHQKFERDSAKLEEIQGEILQQHDESTIKLYFKIHQFLSQEKLLYKQHVSKDQYDIYISGYQIAFERLFEEQQSKRQIKPPPKDEPSIDKKISQSKNQVKPKSGLPPSKPSLIKSESINNQNQQSRLTDKNNIPKKRPEKQSQKQNMSQKQSRMKSGNKDIIDVVFSRMDNYDKSPNQGFTTIAKSLEKQKKIVVVSKMRTSNVDHLHRSKFTGASNFSKSAAKLKGIFANPPNCNIKPKIYQGQLVIQNLDIQRQCQNIRRDQGLRRFKMSLFKNKYIAFEDQGIQIGFKASQIYEKVDKFSAMLDFQLFFGNKSKNIITKFQISFQGDKKSLLYTNPQIIQRTIPGQSQVKMELLNIPKSIPFGLINVNVAYQTQENYRTFTALLPNTILQMVTYYEVEKAKFEGIWGQCTKVLKTQPFKLCRYFSPDQLTSSLPKLKQSVDYAKFAQAGSTIDYELFCQVVIQQSFEGVLKIIIRPDLQVILQVGLYQSQENSVLSFKFFLQSMQMALKQIQT